MELLITFLAGVVVATIIWYFVLRNNRKNVNQWLDLPAETWDKIDTELDEFGDDVKDKVNQILNRKK